MLRHSLIAALADAADVSIADACAWCNVTGAAQGQSVGSSKSFPPYLRADTARNGLVQATHVGEQTSHTFSLGGAVQKRTRAKSLLAHSKIRHHRPGPSDQRNYRQSIRYCACAFVCRCHKCSNDYGALGQR